MVLVGGVYLVVIVLLAAWMDRRFRILSSDALAASVRLIGRELAAALAAAPGPVLPTDAESRTRLKRLVEQMTDRSESVRSLDVVDGTGRIVASDDPQLLGRQAASPEEALRNGHAPYLRVPESALAPAATYELFLPIERNERTVGYLRMAIASSVLSRLFAHQREQSRIWSAVSLIAMALLALTLQFQFYRRGTAAARTLERMISGRVVLPPVRDAAFARVFEEAGRLATQLRKADGVSSEQRADWVVGLTRLHSALAHELKAPLHAMILNVELLERALGRADEPELRETRYLRVIKDEIGRLQRSVTALGAEESAARWELVDVVEVVRSVGELLRAPARERGIEVYVAANGSALVSGFRDRLRQVVLNIANNAIEATASGGRLDFEVEAVREHWRVRVRDTGRGMSEDVLGRLGDGPVTTKETGSGVGLYLARAIVAAHGGKIEVMSAVDVGTCCDIYLPRANRGEP